MGFALTRLAIATALLILPGVAVPLPALSSPQAEAIATPRPDFSGTWILDIPASDSLEAILKAQGVPPIQRQLAQKSQVTQKISQTPSQITIVIRSALGTQTEVLKLDGSLETKTTQRVGTLQTRTYWDSNGTVLVTKTQIPQKNGQTADLTIHRQLRDRGQTMIQQMEMRLPDGQSYKTNRVFRQS